MYHPYSSWALGHFVRIPQRLPTRIRLRCTDDGSRTRSKHRQVSCLSLCVEVLLGPPHDGWRQVGRVPSDQESKLLRVGQPNELLCILLAVRMSAQHEPTFRVSVFGT